MPLSPKQAAERLDLSPTRVRALIKAGTLKAMNVGIDRPVWVIDETELARFAALDRPAHRPRKGTNMTGAIKMDFEYKDGREATEYVILPINEFRNSGAVFEVYDPGMRGSHLLSASDIRANWDSWVGDLIGKEQIVATPPDGVNIY